MDRKLRLTKPLGRVLAQGHPWIFREALDGPRVRPGETVSVVDAKGKFVARGIADSGPIAVRVFTTRDEPVDASLFRKRIHAAAALRDRVVPDDTDAYRLLHGEGDRLPGVVCDVYAAHAVLRFDGQGIEHWRPVMVEILAAELESRGVQHLLIKSGRGDQRQVEAVRGSVPDQPVTVKECGIRLLVDLVQGQKTGMFLDHRESRGLVRRLAGGISVLDLYGYTGGFAVAAGLGGARAVETVDIAPAAIELAVKNWKLNGLEPSGHHVHTEDVFRYLDKTAKAGGRRFDLVVADPPSFAPREASVPAALKGYRNLHRAALDLVAPGGYYLAASCSSHVGREAFEQTLLEGARRARRVFQVLRRWGAPADHPRLLAFPEGDYLKVVLTRMLD